MSFTDGKPWVATEQHAKAPWGGTKSGKRFRCGVCGHRFQVGDTVRFVFANFKESPSRYGNFLTCAWCDGPDVLERRANMEKDAEERFWWFDRGDS